MMARRAIAVVALALLVAACGRGGAGAGGGADGVSANGPDLETAAIAAGVIPDPANTDLTGLYARDTDRVCIVPDRLDYRIGIYVDYGSRQSCSGTGRATRAGNTLQVRFDAAPGCALDARFEGDRIVFPGVLPDACRKLCRGRASLAALDVNLLSNALPEAAALRGDGGKLLCAQP